MKHVAPDFIIIGAMKCGTTTLFNYLADHPETNACIDKEPEYFGTNWERGPKWYASLYKEVVGLKFEASTSYTRYPSREHIPERISQTAPDCKLIYIIRNPVDRIISQLHHQITYRGMPHDAWLADPDFWTKGGGKHAIDASKYFMQIQRYSNYFNREDMLVLHLETLRSAPREVFFEIASFLSIDKKPFDHFLYHAYNQGDTTFVSSNPFSSKIAQKMKRTPGLSRLAIFFGVEVSQPEFTEEMEDNIWGYLNEDMVQLDKYLGYSTGYQRPVRS